MSNLTDDETVRLLRETFADAERLVAAHPVPEPVQRGRSRLLVLGAAASVAAIVIAAVTVGRPDSAGPVDPAADVPTATARPAEWAAVYGAAIVAISAGDRPSAGWPVLYVLNAPRKDADGGTFTQQRGTPFDRATRDEIGIQVALHDPAQVRWVTDEQDAKVAGKECGEVRSKGLIVTVGEVRQVAGHLELRAAGWFGCDGGRWLTYRFDRAGSGWRLTGTVGPQVVS